MRVGRERLLGVLELLDSPAADLEVLLRLLASHSACLSHLLYAPTTHVRVKLGLIVGGAGLLLLGGGRRLSGGLLLGLLDVLLPLLLPLLQLALADIFASNLVEQSLGLGLGGLVLVGSGGVVLDSSALQLVGDLLDTVLDGVDYSLGRHGVYGLVVVA